MLFKENILIIIKINIHTISNIELTKISLKKIHLMATLQDNHASL